MNTSQIKNFAIQSRNILKTGVIQRIQILGFDANGNLTKGEPTRIDIQGGATLFAGEIYDGAFYDRWMALRKRIQEKGVKEIYEEAAYTWFNRLVAIRIMMKNGFIDPVLAYTNEQTRIPRIVAEARAGRIGQMPAADREKLRELMGDDSKINEQFALLIDNFCRNNTVIYNCFGGIEEYISLLLPDNILAPGGFIDLVNHTTYITDEDYKRSELIGWLYQFYISERKDEVFAKQGKYDSDEIPAATQIFTPNWVVKYMVQNTIGRIYLDNNPWATKIKNSLDYLVNTSESTPIDTVLKLDSLEDYKLLDNACGSGHILVEAFGLFYQMYLEDGFSSHSAIELILSKNLLGIDLDTRAKQLATFALLMTAAQIDQSFLDCKIMPRVLNMPSYHFSRPLNVLLREFYMGDDRSVMDETMDAFSLLEKAEVLGSIMIFTLSPNTRKEMEIRYREWMEICSNGQVVNSCVHEILPSISLILALTDEYSAVVTNPPYMGAGKFEPNLAQYVDQNYSSGKTDLFSVFMIASMSLLAQNGKLGMINLPSWLFLSSFEQLRREFINHYHIDSLIHMGRGIFGIDWGSVAFCITNSVSPQPGYFFRPHKRNFQHVYYYHIGQLFQLINKRHDFRFDFDSYREIDVTESEIYPFEYSQNGIKMFFESDQKDFLHIPGCLIGYWISKKTVNSFIENQPLAAIANPRKGLVTLDDNRFIHNWFEVAKVQFTRPGKSKEEVLEENRRWVVCNKGGGSRKWYGLNGYVINWFNDGQELKDFIVYKYNGGSYTKEIRSENFYFQEGITWSGVTSGNPSFRYFEKGGVFSSSGPSAFPKENLWYILALLNSATCEMMFKLLSPTLSVLSGDIAKIPIRFENVDEISSICKKTVAISKLDWDAHESSWGFCENELIRILKEHSGEGIFIHANSIEDIVGIYKELWVKNYKQMHAYEEELNRQFIEIYGLQDELTPVVPLDCISILQHGEISVESESIVWHNDVLAKQLLSYAIGCMMGRYRLDRPGLQIAHPNPLSEEINPYVFQDELFEIDDDGIIPLLSRDCPFDDNAYNRVVKFVRQVFGESSLNENLNFIESSLGKTIENYFVKDFWKDHKKMYSNRPIYWLFSSKKGAFQCLTYMHRMNPYTAEAVRSKYLLPYIDFLKNKIAADMDRASSLSTVERKNLDKMQTTLDECLEYEERLHDIADRQIRFDLDDGVLVNYAKFGDVLAKIK